MSPPTSFSTPSYPTHPQVMAVIPHYRQTEQLERCLAALSASTLPVAPWVHDNTANNLGFTKAVNLGLKAAFAHRAEYALVLNQDCYVRADAVSHLLRFMDAHPRCGLAGLKQLALIDPDFIMHAGCAEAFPRGRHHTGRKSKGDHAFSRPMPWVNGAAIFARMAAVLEFGLLDENMILFGSDSDWCYTARMRGWEVWYCADAEAVHEGGVSCRNLSAEVEKIFSRDMRWWQNKWVGTALFNRITQQIPYQEPIDDPRPKPATEAAAAQ